MENRKKQRVLAVFMSFIMMITLPFTNGVMVKANDDAAGQKSISFSKKEANGVTGTISYRLGEEWISITDWDASGSYTLLLDAAVESVDIKAVPDEGGYINQSTSKIGDRNIDAQDAKNLKTNGHTVNFNGAVSINVEIEFDNNSGQIPTGTDETKQYEPNTFNFNVTNYLGEGGQVFVKLYNGETDITSKFEIADQLVKEENGPEGYLHVICKGEIADGEWHYTDMSSVPLVIEDGAAEIKATAIQILIQTYSDEYGTFLLSDEVCISKNNNGDGDTGNVRINKYTEDGAYNSAYNSLLEDGYLYNLSNAAADADAFYEMKFAFANPNESAEEHIGNDILRFNVKNFEFGSISYSIDSGDMVDVRDENAVNLTSWEGVNSLTVVAKPADGANLGNYEIVMKGTVTQGDRDAVQSDDGQSIDVSELGTQDSVEINIEFFQEENPNGPGNSYNFSWNTMNGDEKNVLKTEYKLNDDTEWKEDLGRNLNEGDRVAVRMDLAAGYEIKNLSAVYMVDDNGGNTDTSGDERRLPYVTDDTSEQIAEALVSENGYTFTFKPEEDSQNTSGETGLEASKAWLRIQFDLSRVFAEQVTLNSHLRYF